MLTILRPLKVDVKVIFFLETPEPLKILESLCQVPLFFCIGSIRMTLSVGHTPLVHQFARIPRQSLRYKIKRRINSLFVRFKHAPSMSNMHLPVKFEIN